MSLETDRLLAPLLGSTPPAPPWFSAALAKSPDRQFVDVKGASIETLSWGRRGNPGLLLLHGQGAHADWWSFIAPFLADSFRVAALSWSGMGRSGWRAGYDIETYADELFAVAKFCGLLEAVERPLVVGHSYGGMPLLYAAKERGRELRGAIIIDSYFRSERELQARSGATPEVRPTRLYPTLAAALSRFRLEPRQGCENLFVVDYVARHSLKQAEPEGNQSRGWVWRFDPAIRLKTRKVAMAPYLEGAECPLLIMAGERSNLITPSTQTDMLQIAPPGTPWVWIPDADHHVLLDQPLALATALRSALALWPR